MKYQINFIKNIRVAERKAQAQKSVVTILSFATFALLLLSIGYAVTNVFKMNLAITKEQTELARIEAEYRKYKTTRMIVNKEDIELLDRLQHGRIFWTKKLAAMAFHLPNTPPNSYWITKFGYKSNALKVNGYGFITPKQEQLITIDDYLNSLRGDTSFADVFTSCFLTTTRRDDEGYRERVTFEYSAEKPSKRKRGRR